MRIVFLDLGAEYTWISIYKTSSHCTHKICALYYSKLSFRKWKKKKGAKLHPYLPLKTIRCQSYDRNFWCWQVPAPLIISWGHLTSSGPWVVNRNGEHQFQTEALYCQCWTFHSLFSYCRIPVKSQDQRGLDNCIPVSRMLPGCAVEHSFIVLSQCYFRVVCYHSATESILTNSRYLGAGLEEQ